MEDTIEPIDYVALQHSGDITDPRDIGSHLNTGLSPSLTPRAYRRSCFDSRAI